MPPVAESSQVSCLTNSLEIFIPYQLNFLWIPPHLRTICAASVLHRRLARGAQPVRKHLFKHNLSPQVQIPRIVKFWSTHQHYFSLKMLEEEEVSDVHIDQNQNPLDEIFRVGVDHSGQYECRPSNSQPANISLVVLEGETFSQKLWLNPTFPPGELHAAMQSDAPRHLLLLSRIDPLFLFLLLLIQLPPLPLQSFSAFSFSPSCPLLRPSFPSSEISTTWETDLKK